MPGSTAPKPLRTPLQLTSTVLPLILLHILHKREIHHACHVDQDVDAAPECFFGRLTALHGCAVGDIRLDSDSPFYGA